ncbi:MAG: DUF4197 family protein, partial [Chitinophagales bacterium]
MFNRTFITALIAFACVFSGCDSFNLDDITSGLTEEKVAAGLKEALNIGTDTAVVNGSQTDGYFMNPFIKIPFPEEANVVMSVVSAVPGGSILV